MEFIQISLSFRKNCDESIKFSEPYYELYKIIFLYKQMT